MKVTRSKKPCRECKTTERTVRLKDQDLDIVLCLEHVYDDIPEPPPSKKKGKGKDLPGQKKLVET